MPLVRRFEFGLIPGQSAGGRTKIAHLPQAFGVQVLRTQPALVSPHPQPGTLTFQAERSHAADAILSRGCYTALIMVTPPWRQSSAAQHCAKDFRAPKGGE